MQDALARDVVVEPAAATTGERLGFALFAYALAVILIITLLPFHFDVPQRLNIDIGDDLYAAIVGILLFVPLGLFYRLATSQRNGSIMGLIAMAVLISALIEAIQLFDVTRQTTVLDVAANTLGALIGGICFDAIGRSAKQQGSVIGWLGLEIPMMGLVYLLVPLLWVGALGGRGELVPVAMALLLGAFGARLLGGLQRCYFGPRKAADPHHTAAFAGAWFFLGAFAMLVWQPLGLIVGVVIATALTWWIGSRPLGDAGSNRRFEAALLRSAAPIYGAYLLMLIALPLAGGIVPWHDRLWFPRLGSSQAETARLLEVCAAFTLLGYMLVEIRGRQIQHFGATLPRLIGWSLVLAIAMEVARGFGVQGASLARGVLAVGACVYGGWLYHLQRAHVMSILGKHRA